MKEEDLENIYTALKKGVQNIFKSNESLESFSWTSAAIWNDDWYDNTVSKIIVNEKYSCDGFGEIQNIKQEFNGLYFHDVSELGLKYLAQIIDHYLDESFKKVIFLSGDFSEDYVKAKKEIKDTIEMAFSSREYLNYLKVSVNERQYFYDGESFMTLFESISINSEVEHVNLLQFILREKVVNEFFKLVDGNPGLQKLINKDYQKFIRIANSYCKERFLTTLMQDEVLKYFREVVDLLDSVFNVYYSVESPFQRLDEIKAHEIIPSLAATREEIEIRKWRTN